MREEIETDAGANARPEGPDGLLRPSRSQFVRYIRTYQPESPTFGERIARAWTGTIDSLTVVGQNVGHCLRGRCSMAGRPGNPAKPVLSDWSIDTSPTRYSPTQYGVRKISFLEIVWRGLHKAAS